MLFSNIYKKKIISENGKLIGFVQDVVIDYNNKKILFILFDDIKNIINKNKNPEEIINDLKSKSIPYYNIVKIEKDKIIVKGE